MATNKGKEKETRFREDPGMVPVDLKKVNIVNKPKTPTTTKKNK